MFNGFKDPSNCYTNQPLFENCNQPPFLPCEGTKQTSAPPWDYSSQSYNNVPFYPNDQHLNHRLPPPIIHNPSVLPPQFERKETSHSINNNNNVLVHYPNSSNSHQSVVRPTALINCQSRGNLCCNHPGRITHWGSSVDSVRFLGNPSLTKDIPSFSQTFLHDEARFRPTDNFATSLNKLSKFPRDASANHGSVAPKGVKKSVTSPVESCSSRLQPSHEEVSEKFPHNKSTKKESCLSCQDDCRSSCRMYDHQAVVPEFANLDTVSQDIPHPVTTTRENVVRYSGHSSVSNGAMTQPCNQWPSNSHSQPDMWLPNNHPNIWMPPDGMRLPNNGPPPGFWMERNGNLASGTTQLPTYQEVVQYKSHGPVDKKRIQDQVRYCETQRKSAGELSRYDEGLPKKNDEVLQDKYPGMTKYSDSQRKNQELYGRCPDNTRYHNVRADPSHLLKHQDVSKELESMCHKVPNEGPETSKHSGAVISHTSVVAPYGVAQDTFPSPETGRRYGDSNLNNIHNGRTNYAPYPRNRPSENYTTGIAQPPSRFSPQMTYTQSKISRSSNDLLLSHQCSESFTAPLAADCNLSGNNFSSLACHNSPGSMVEKASNQYHASNDIVVDFTVSSVQSKNTTDVIRYSASKDPGNIYNLPGLEPCNKMPDGIVYGKTMQVVDSYHVDKRDIKSSGSYATSKSHPLACNSYQSIQNRNETEYNLFYNNTPPNHQSHFENNGANMNMMPLNSGVRERNLISSVVPNDGSTDVFNLSDDCTGDRVDRPIKKRKSRFKGPVKEERYCVSQSLKRWTRNNQGSGEPVLDVRQFLATWDEESEDLTTSPKLPDVILSENNSSLYVVDSNHLESASENHNSSLVPVYEQLNEPIRVPVSDVNIDFELSKNDANYKTSNVTTKDEEAKSLGLVAGIVHDSVRSSNNSPLSQSSVTVDGVESHAAKKVLKNDESNSSCIADGVLSPMTSSSVTRDNKTSNKISEKSFTINSCPLESMITSDVDISSNGNQLKENSSKSSDLTDEPDRESQYAHVSVSDEHKLKTDAVMTQSSEPNSDCVIKPCDETMSEDADICVIGPVKETGCVDKLASPEEKPSSGASMPDISNAPLNSVNEDEQVTVEDRKDLPVLETATPIPSVAADQEHSAINNAPEILQLNKENLNESKIKFCSNQQGNLNNKNSHIRISTCSESDDSTPVKDCNYEEKVAEVINYKSANCDNAVDTCIFEPANTPSHSTCSPSPHSYSALPKAEENSPYENSQTSPLVDTEDSISMSNLVDKLQNAINGQAYKERGCSSNATVERHKSVKHKFDSRCTTPDSVSVVSTPSYTDTQEDFDFESGMSSYEDEQMSDSSSLMKKQNISTDITSIGKEVTREISKLYESISESAVTLNHESLDNSFIKPNITVSPGGETSSANDQLTSKFKECNKLSENNLVKNKSVVSTVQDSVSLPSNNSGCDADVTSHFGIADFNDQKYENVSSPPSSPVTQLTTCGGETHKSPKRAIDSLSEEYLPLLTDGSSTVSHLNTFEPELCNHSSQQSDTSATVAPCSEQEGNHTGKCNLLEENTVSNLESPQNIHVQVRSSDEFKNLESSDNQNDPSKCNSVETQKDNQIVAKPVKEEIICGGVDRVEENKIFYSNLQNSETVKDKSIRPISERKGVSGFISLTSMESLDNGQPLLLNSPNCIKYHAIPGAEENSFCDSEKDPVDIHKLADMNAVNSGRKSKQHEDLLQDNSEDFEVCVIAGEELQGIVRQSSDCTVESVTSCDVEDNGQVSGTGDRAIISTEEKANQQEDRLQENYEDYNTYSDVAINPKDVDSVHSNEKRREVKTDLDTCEKNSCIETDIDEKCNKLPNSKLMSDTRTSPSSPGHKEQSSVYAFESQLLDEQKPSHCENSNEVVDNESVGVLPSLETSNKSNPAEDLMLSSSGDEGLESKDLETEGYKSFNVAVENNCIDSFNDNKFEIFNSTDLVKKSEEEPTSTEMPACENVDNNDYKDTSTPKEEDERTSSISSEICEFIGNSENLDAPVKDDVVGKASVDIKCTSGLEFSEDKLFSNEMCHVKNNNCAGLKSENNELCCEVTAEDSNKQGLETHVEQHFKGYGSESLIEQRADDTASSLAIPSDNDSNLSSTAIKHIPENENILGNSSLNLSTESSINHPTQEESTESFINHCAQEEQAIPIGDPSSEIVITAEDSTPCVEEMPHLEVSSEVVPDDSETLEMPCLEAMSDSVCVVTELNEPAIPDIPSAPVTDKSYDNMKPMAGLGMTENQNSGNCEDNTVTVNGAKDINGNCTFKNDEPLVIKSGETQDHNSSPVEENHGTLLVRDEVTPIVDNETDLQISQDVLHINHYNTQPDATDVPFVASDPDISINSSIVEVLPADLVSNWPYVEEEVFAETPTANTESTELEVNSCTHDSMSEVERKKSVSVVNNSSVSSLPVNSSSKENVEKFNLAAGGLKCRLSWKKIFDLSKFNERKKVRVKEKKVTSHMLHYNDGVASEKGDVDRKKNSKKGIIDGLELGPAKIEVRLAPKPPFSKDQFKMWQVVDDPNNEKGGRWSCTKESNNNYISSDGCSNETREATGSTPIVLVKKLILKCRGDGSGNSSSDHSECDARNSSDDSSPDCSSNNSDFDHDNPEDDLLQIRCTKALSCPKTSIQEAENSTKEKIENIKNICATLNGNTPTKEQNENLKDICATQDGNTPFSPLPSDCEDGQIHQSRLGDQSNLLSNETSPVSPRYSSNDSYDSSTSQDSSTRGKQKQQLPRVIIKRTGCGTAKYRSFLRVSEADTSHWQPVVALQRNSFLDNLSRKIMQNGLAGKHVNVDSAALEKMGFITDVSKRKVSKLIESNPLKLQDDFTKMKTESRKQCDSKDEDTVNKAVEKHSKELKQTFQNEKRKGEEEDKFAKSKCYKDRRLDKDIKTSRKGYDGSPKKNKESYVNVRGDFYTKDNCAEDNSLVLRENFNLETKQSDDVKNDEQCFGSDGAVCNNISQSESKEGEMFDIETEIKSSIIQKKISKDCDQNSKGLGSSTTEQTHCSVVVGCRKRSWQESQASAPGGEQCSDTKKKCDSHSLCPESEGDEVLSKRAEVKDDGACRACGWVFGDKAERAAHVRQHPYHCQRCHLAFKSEVDFVSHLSSEHPSTREQHHCLLCERSFTTAAKHRLHLSGRLHRQLEATQRRTIHTIFTILTGHNCPGISPLTESEMASLRWFPSEPGAVHFYHQATPLQMAVQDWTIRQREANHAGSKPPSEETELTVGHISTPSPTALSLRLFRHWQAFPPRRSSRRTLIAAAMMRAYRNMYHNTANVERKRRIG